MCRPNKDLDFFFKKLVCHKHKKLKKETVKGQVRTFILSATMKR